MQDVTCNYISYYTFYTLTIFLNVYIKCPIAQNYITLQNLTALICVLQEKRARVNTTDAMLQSAAKAKPSTVEKEKQSLGSFFKSSTVQLEDAMEAELNSYLVTPAIDGEEDPLVWWKVYNVNFLMLSKLAQIPVYTSQRFAISVSEQV